LRPAYAAFVPGLDGAALELRYQAGGVGVEAGGTRFFVGRSAATASTPDEVYLRYYVRFAPEFDFGAGGVLPGLCGGKCVAPLQIADGRESFLVRLHWLPTGEIAFEPNLPGLKPRQKRWGRFVVPGSWHCLELHVRLNQPDQDDGLIEGWFDGDKAAELPALRIRDVAGLGVTGVAFESFFRGRVGAGPRREGRIRFDDMVLARSYVGPRAPK
jgi:hypothetical protein